MANNKSGTEYLRQPRPLYQQVKDEIVRQIDSGNWQADLKIPSENELVASLKVSRMTVNRALRELTAEGRLIRLQGVGTFVAPPKPRSALFDLRSIADEIRSRGGIHSSDVITMEEIKASQFLAASMGLPEDSVIYHSIIVHRDSGAAILMSERFINPSFAPDYINQDFTKTTPNEYLTKVSPASEAEHIVEAILPDDRVQQLLEIDASEPCLVLYRRTWVDDIVVTKSRFVYPGSKYQLGSRFKPGVHTNRIEEMRYFGG